MSMVSTMRPGVYATYTVLGGQAARTAATAGVIAASTGARDTEVRRFTRLSDALAQYGEQGIMAAVLRLLFAGGISSVFCAGVGEDPGREEYLAAYELLNAQDGIKAIVCDAQAMDARLALAQKLEESALHSRERVCYLGAGAGRSEEELAQRARELNCERLCLLAPAVGYAQEETKSGVYLAAAACAAVTAQSDPAANLNLLELAGPFDFPPPYGEREVTALLEAGVTLAEQTSGRARLIRALTTKTSRDGRPDNALRELSTVRILDDVLPALRELLAVRLQGAKNNAATRDAIRTQLACELQKKKDAGIIDDYQPPVVFQKADEPTVCVAEVTFGVVYGMHRIELIACITV